jgi:hypothetical protein
MNRIKSAPFNVALALLLTYASGVAPAAEPKDILSPKEVKALVAHAKTPADHLKLARHFNASADKHDAEAAEHEALAAEYTRRPRVAKIPMSPNSAEHCKYYAEHCRKAAKELRGMAAAHQAMAKGDK